MGKYTIEPNFSVPQDERSETNEILLRLIQENDYSSISKNDIFNCYTGLGGLHGLEFKDFDSFHDFTKAKQEFEAGQFFTPHETCEEIMKHIPQLDSDKIIDPTCGMGNFANYVNKEENFTGYDIDVNALKVAKALYPSSTFIEQSFEYQPENRYDIIVGNPPFNIKWVGGLSQKVYLENVAHYMMKRGTVVALIVPQSFFNDEFMFKKYYDRIKYFTHFIGQYKLPNSEFKQMGCKSFPTKVMFFVDHNEYDIAQTELPELDIFNDFEDKQTVLDRVKAYKMYVNNNKVKLDREDRQNGVIDEEAQFKEITTKLLYEIKTHPTISSEYDKSLEFIEKYRTQSKPIDMSHEDWQLIRITKKGVINRLKKIVREQNKVNKYEIKLIRNRSRIILKGGSAGANAHVTNIINDLRKDEEIQLYKNMSMHHILVESEGGKTPTEILQSDIQKVVSKINTKKYKFIHESVKPVLTILDKKSRKYLKNIQAVSDADVSNEIQKFVDDYRFDKINDDERIECTFNEIQNFDLGKACTRNIVALNWEQGCGKTAVSFAWAEYKMKTRNIRNTFILSSAVAINITWTDFCEANNVDYIRLEKPSQLKDIKKGQFVLVTTSMMRTLYKSISRFNKYNGQKNAIIFDESDAMTNSGSKLTRSVKAAFRKLRYKLIATGTLTRNNLSELYPQVELLFNNNEFMLSRPEMMYRINDKGIIVPTENNNRNFPFAYRGGFANFKACFCPSKSSVFGVDKQDQSIYNIPHIQKFIESFCIVRTFEEVVGENKCIHHTHVITPSTSEVALQTEIANEFHTMRRKYFAEQDNYRKDAQLRIMQQIKLMIRSCSMPHLFHEWLGEDKCTKSEYVLDMLAGDDMKNEIVAIGVTGLPALAYYETAIKERFNRPLFIVHGQIKPKDRKAILKQFENSGNGILIATQTSLENSVNVPTCDHVIIESFQWNFPRMSQFYFRFIRYDSKFKTNVHFIVYDQTIETNLMNLLIAKEKMNIFVKRRTAVTDEMLLEKYNIPQWLTESQIIKEYDEQGGMSLGWGSTNY